MKIEIVVYSETGKTLQLAELVRDKLSGDGHQVGLTRLQTSAPFDSKHMLPMDKIEFTNLPDVGAADCVLVGGPVWAFRSCPAAKKAIRDLGPQIKGKKFLPFVTHAFPFDWMAGTWSANGMGRVARNQGADVLSGVVLSGSGKKDRSNYNLVAEKIRDTLK
ncbi:MAG: flavodoxin family protein [Candidatus Syntrophosphaera sp.]